ncbi:MAG: hypothetical protein R3D98_15830 [Candidatus Krumholzibacteriia bacterium]
MTMRMITIVVGVALCCAAPAVGYDLGNRAPEKPVAGHGAPLPDPEVIRQGGDTIADAVLLTWPVVGVTGTTVGYTNDYDEACPYTDSTAPDVVYKFTPERDIVVDIDMLGSAYDTKIYVYDSDFQLIACNDDFYPDYVSKIEHLPVSGAAKYYLVIDGYGEEAGDYVLTITEFEPCVVDCPAGAPQEGEPPLVDGYVDNYNGGCNTEGSTPFGSIDWGIFCGTSGWYISPNGIPSRDTDWYVVTIPSSGFFHVIGDAEYPTYMFELAPQDCASVAVIQSTVIGPCFEGTMTIHGAAGSTAWFWIGPTTFDGAGEYTYVLYSNLWGLPVRTEPHTWSTVKQLFD